MNEMNWFAWMMVALAVMAGALVVWTIVEAWRLLRIIRLRAERIRNTKLRVERFRNAWLQKEISHD